MLRFPGGSTSWGVSKMSFKISIEDGIKELGSDESMSGIVEKWHVRNCLLNEVREESLSLG